MSDEQTVSAEFAAQLTAAQPDLYRYIVTLTGRAEESRDILQNANLKILREAGAFDPARSFWVWVRSIAYFEILTWRRKQMRERLVFDDVLLEEVAHELDTHSQASGLMLEILEECKAKLPANMRRTLAMRYDEGLAISEMARALRRQPNTVSASLYRIRQLLSDCIESVLKSGRRVHAD